MTLRESLRAAVAGGSAAPPSTGDPALDAEAVVHYADTAAVRDAEALSPLVQRASHVPFDEALDGDAGRPLDDPFGAFDEHLDIDVGTDEGVVAADSDGTADAADLEFGAGRAVGATDRPGEPDDPGFGAGADVDDHVVEPVTWDVEPSATAHQDEIAVHHVGDEAVDVGELLADAEPTGAESDPGLHDDVVDPAAVDDSGFDDLVDG